MPDASDAAGFADLCQRIGPDDLIGARELREVWQETAFKGDMAALLDAARARTARNAAMRSKPPAGYHRLKRTRPAEDILNLRATREIVTALEPHMGEFRQVLFGRPEPPFKSLQAAAAWIEGHSAKRGSEAYIEEDRRYQTEVRPRLDEMNRTDRWLTYGAFPTEVEYWDGRDLTTRRRSVPKDDLLAVILGSLQLVVERTTLPLPVLLAWVLAGVRPGDRERGADGRAVTFPGLGVLSRQRLLTTNTAPDIDQVIITVDARELTDRNLRRIRQWAQRLIRPRRLTGRQQQAVEVVQQLGGPPRPRYDRAFWQRAAQRLRVDDLVAAARLYYRAVSPSPKSERRASRARR